MDVKKTLKRIGVRPKKGFGQNFLQDETIIDSILSHAEVRTDDTVLEIGAGLGVLTEPLSKRAGRVIALEIDPVLCAYLSERFHRCENVRILLQDVLRFDARDLPEEGVKVLGNLPYYISTPILMHLLKSVQRFSLILLMFQKELAERITAGPGSRKYGSLSIAVQFHTRAEVTDVVPRSAFYPVPEVDSALVRLRILKEHAVAVQDREGFFRVVRAAFSHRRKTLRNALIRSGSFPAHTLDAAFEAAGILPTRRAETLTLREFAELAQFLL